MSHSYYLTRKYGPISIGRSPCNNNRTIFGYGIGRTITIVYSCDSLDNNDVVLDEEKQQTVETWIRDEWEDKIIVDDATPELEVLKTLDTMKAIDLMIMPSEYSCNLKLSCKYLYDKLNSLVQLISRGRCWIVEIEILEQRESFGFKIDRYFSQHK